MTKRKTSPFSGAWMSSLLVEAKPVPAWANVEEKEALEQEVSEGDARKWNEIFSRIRNEPGNIDPGPVMAALMRAVEVWRFERQRCAADPEPAQWASILRAIEVPNAPMPGQIDMLNTEVSRLPAQVIGVLNTALFRRCEVGTSRIFERMREGDEASAAMLRDTLRDMIDALRGLRGRSGPRLRPVMAARLRAVHAAIVAASDVKPAPARALAAGLLRQCGIPAPEGRSQLADLFRK